MYSEEDIPQEVIEHIERSSSRREKLRKMTNADLRYAVINVIYDLPIMSFASDVLNEVEQRLSVIDESPEVLSLKIDMTETDPFEDLSEEFVAEMDYNTDRVLAMLTEED